LILYLWFLVDSVDLHAGISSRLIFHLLISLQHLRESSLRPLIILRDSWMWCVIYGTVVFLKQILRTLLFPWLHLILESFAISTRHSVILLVFTIFITLRNLKLKWTLVLMILIYAWQELFVRRLHIKLLHLKHKIRVIKSLKISWRSSTAALV